MVPAISQESDAAGPLDGLELPTGLPELGGIRLERPSVQVDLLRLQQLQH